jgi:hypothetical protein
MRKSRRVSLICGILILAILFAGFMIAIWPRSTPVRFANVTDKRLMKVEVQFVGQLVRFGTIEPRTTVVRSIPFGREARADGVVKPCPRVRLTIGKGAPLLFGPGEPGFKIPVQEMSFQLDDASGTPRIHVEAIDRNLIGYRYTSFHMKPSSRDSRSELPPRSGAQATSPPSRSKTVSGDHAP